MKNFNKKALGIFTIVITLFFSFLGFRFITKINSTTELPDYEPIDIGPELRSRDYPLKKYILDLQISNHLRTASDEDEYYSVGDQLEWLVDDSEYEPFLDNFTLKAIGTNAEVWVQNDMSYPDGRETPVITQENVTYILSQFDNNIYETTTSYFGVPDFHNGSKAEIVSDLTYYEENGRSVILISNIRDEMYYSRSYPYYVVGFYWSIFERAFDRNIISIDSHDWENRLGEDAARPNLYESVVAHEYQHLIHDDYNPEDDLFMNEGCSMYAEPLCGYPIDWDSINSFLYTPDNSLTIWGDQGDINILADYGQALLWSIYLSDHYEGAEFLSYFVKSGIPGIEGINNALSHFGYTETFEDVFYNWAIANLLHTGDGKYNYKSIDLGCEEAIDARVYDIKRPFFNSQLGTDFGQTKTDLHRNTGVYMLGSYGCDYIKLSGLKDSMSEEFLFDGFNKANISRWTKEDQDGDGDLEWYSTSAGPERDIALIAEYELPYDETVTLAFMTYYDIEELWDYGFVQVSNDLGVTWTSLSNDNTTWNIDPDGYPSIKENLPGLTGSSGDWVPMEFDLSDYKGQEVSLSFRYMTDWATENPGWWIDNITINNQLIDDADEIVLFTVPPLPETDFIVSIIEVTVVNEEPVDYEILELILDSVEETGSLELNSHITEECYLLIIVSPKLGPADYIIELTRF